MRFALTFKLYIHKIPVNYRPILISFLKYSLSQYQNGAYFESYYKDTKEKPFTFSLSLGSCRFLNDDIIIPEKRITLHFSTSDPITGIHFYNAFLLQKGKSFSLPNQNSMTLKGFFMEKETIIVSNSILCNFVAPLCIRLHNEDTNEDAYLTYKDTNFEMELKHILKNQIKHNPDLSESMVNQLLIVPYECKTTMVKHYNHCIPATIGTILIKGDIRILNFLYQSGVASRKSSGFGYFIIVKQGG